jgi:hypothetical protein
LHGLSSGRICNDQNLSALWGIIVSYFHLVTISSCCITGDAPENTLLSSKEQLALWVNLSCLFSYIIFVRSNLCTHDPTLISTVPCVLVQ